jgi:hypothetical protein
MMQNSINKVLFMLLLGVIIASSCSTKRKTTERKVTLCQDTLDGSNLSFPEGKYYTFRFDEVSGSAGIVPEKLLKSLSDDGIGWEQAWYKAPARMCVPPGSDMGMMVIVEPAFVIKTSGQQKDLSAYGLAETSAPDLGECAFRVQHFHQKIE